MTTDDAHAGAGKAQYVRRMFGAVARRYDLLNHLLSAGLDVGWRRRAAEVACPDAATAAAGPLVVDVCCGTGDLAAAVLAQAPAARVVACDFCRPMLERARRKFDRRGLSGRATVVEADALALPLADAAADAATCAFGLRNLIDPARGLAEMVRVVRPGGRVVVLEFHQPQARGLVGRLFGLYFRRILPRLGAWVARDRHGGYAYLVASIDAFGPPRQTAAAMEDAGLADVVARPLAGGIASVFAGRKPG